MIIAFFVALFANHWIWLIFTQNKAVFVILIIVAFSLCFKFKWRNIALIATSLLLFGTFFKTTERMPLSHLSPAETQTQIKRLNSYPPLVIQKIPYWLEMKPVTLSLYKMQNNTSSLFDINYYFFGSYPRESQTPGEFVKFPFIFLIPAFIGVYRIKGKDLRLIIYILLSSSLAIFVGDRNHLGVYPAFPIWVYLIKQGLKTKL